MKIAIIGAGFAGLSTAYYLLNESAPNNSPQITLFDPLGLNGKASSIAAGLLHPFGGMHAKLNRFGLEAFHESKTLLEAAEKAIKMKVYKESGLLRVALTPSQEEDYLKCKDQNLGVHYLTPAETIKQIPGLNAHPSIFIEKARTVYTKKYLAALFLACQQLDAKKGTFGLEKTKINSLEELKEFDYIVITAGADCKLFKQIGAHHLTLTKGQILQLKWNEELEPLPFPISSKAYLVMTEDNNSCIVGATFEKKYVSEEKDQSFAISDIMPKAVSLIPALKECEIEECRAAVRVSTKNHLPLVEQVCNELTKGIKAKIFLFTGLGSKGLLYHAFYGKKLVEMMINQR